MSRLDELYVLRDFINREIKAETSPMRPEGRGDRILASVADLYDVRPEEVLKGGRSARIAHVRHCVAWLLRRDGLSMREVADALNYSDHTTAHYAIRKVENDQATRALLRGLEAS